MRGRNLIKLLKALELFSKPEGTTIEEMAEHLEVDRRSVYRLISLSEELGFPIYDEKIPLEKDKRWVLSYGANAKLLEPEKLRKEIVDELEVAKDKYR